MFIYLHGFNSAYDPESEKIQLLSQLGEVRGISYDSFDSFDNIKSYIASQVPETDELVFVGTSLGGFWAAEMARMFGAPSVIINPCHDPETLLQKYVGVEHVNYQTGEHNILAAETVSTYKVSLNGSDRNFLFLPLVLLDMGDDVIDSHETIHRLAGYPMTKWAGGSHRFEHMEEALTNIKEYVNICSFIDQGNF
jgi:predicted esterase YcpF (UPF0227 family)